MMQISCPEMSRRLEGEPVTGGAFEYSEVMVLLKNAFWDDLS